MDAYLSTWMPQALTDYLHQSEHLIQHSPEFRAAIDTMIRGFQASRCLAHDCDCLQETFDRIPYDPARPLSFDPASSAYQDYLAQRDYHDRQARAAFDAGMHLFVRHYHELWW